MGETFEAHRFLAGLDDAFTHHAESTTIARYLDDALTSARNAADTHGELTVLNEMIGFNRSHALHEKNRQIIATTLNLARSMNIDASPSWVATLINAATGYRAAGDTAHAETLYREALEANATLAAPDMRQTAALHNNLSMLYSDIRSFTKAEEELRQALNILEHLREDTPKTSNARETQDNLNVDIASTHTNLALVLLAQQRVDEAQIHSTEALKIYEHGHLTDRAHYASALACQGQVLFHQGFYAKSVEHYQHALSLIEERFGTESDYYRTTHSNLMQAQASRNEETRAQSHTTAHPHMPETTSDAASSSHEDCHESTDGASRDGVSITGLQLARAYWEHYGKAMLADKFPRLTSRIAVGLVGHGSQCFGFDDALSRDHDFAPGVCMWLTDEDYAQFGTELQAEYDKLPKTFMGFAPDTTSVRAHGSNKRYGVFAIGDFFEAITGLKQAPRQREFPLWLSLDEATLATASNGAIFADPLGVFSKTRQEFTFMPEDVRISLISRRMGMMAQAGQYNVARMAARQDWPAVWLSIAQFVDASSSLIFLINNPVTAGYLPYYKWQFAALRKLASRMGMVLREVPGQLEALIDASCTMRAQGKISKSDVQAVSEIIESICANVVQELHRQHLSESDETFLEWQRPYVESHIVSKDTCLRSL